MPPGVLTAGYGPPSLIGETLLRFTDKLSGVEAKLQRLAAADPDPGVRELWSEAELAADYPPTEPTPAV